MELWKTVPEYPEYEVSNYGHVRRLIPNRMPHGGIRLPVVLKPGISQNGYARVTFSINKTVTHHSVHRLVLTTFHRPRLSNEQTNHKDGNKLNNHLDNLEWVTPSQNQTHAEQLGLWNCRGERQWKSKLTEPKVRAIRAAWISRKVTHPTLAKRFGVSQVTIARVLQGRSWIHVV